MAKMRGHNHVQLIGNVGQPPELRKTKEGDDFATFTIATNTPAGPDGQLRTDWHFVCCRGDVAIRCARAVKGSLVMVAGALRRREWQDRAGATRSASEVEASEVLVLTYPKT